MYVLILRMYCYQTLTLTRGSNIEVIYLVCVDVTAIDELAVSGSYYFQKKSDFEKTRLPRKCGRFEVETKVRWCVGSTPNEQKARRWRRYRHHGRK